MATTSKPGESGLSQGGTGTQDITQQAKETASDVAGLAKEKLSTTADRPRDRAASSIGGVAQAIRRTGDEIGEESPFSDYLGKAADGVERIGEYFRSKDLGEVVEDVERFARREPALFLGAAFTAGLLGARFLKSSSHRRGSGSYDDRPDYPPDYRARDRDLAERSDRFAAPKAAAAPTPVATPSRPSVPGGTGGRP